MEDEFMGGLKQGGRKKGTKWSNAMGDNVLIAVCDLRKCGTNCLQLPWLRPPFQALG